MGTHNILIVGDSGMHKTWFLSTCPDPFIYDFDKGLQVADMDKRLPHATFRDISPQMMYHPEMAKAGLYPTAQGWLAFIKHYNDLIQSFYDKKVTYKTIGLDSLTFMQELAMSKILKDTKQEQPHQGSYGAQQKYIKEVLNALTMLPINLVATAHIQRDENDVTKVTEKLPLVTGKLAGMLGAFFQEVWFVEAVEDKTRQGGVKWVIRNTAIGMNKQAKSRKWVPDGTELDWRIIEPFLEAKPPEETAAVALVK